jgi:sulfite exporter TauE/SafE
MCGGFVVSYTAKDAKEGRKSYKSHIMYGIGKTISYTFIGAIFGLFGSIITFTPKIRGIAGIAAGAFLIIFGINMLGFNLLRKFRLKTPRIIQKFISSESKENNGPFTTGLLNGLMIACGPLQAIYILAAGTGSALEGAKMLFVFALGTLPIMLGFGLLTSIISKNATHKILKASGFIVILLGAIMLNRGLVLAGAGFDASSIINNAPSARPPANTISSDGYQTIRMNVTSNGWEPNSFVLKKGVPVKWIINGKELNGCNNAIVVPDYELNFRINPGEQTIEFTPNKEGTVSWSCWMGMIKGRFIVKNDINLNDNAAVQKELNTAPVQKSRSCGGNGCGCGMMG